MADEKAPSNNPEAEATDEVDPTAPEAQDKTAERAISHPGFKYYRKTRQFGG
jgi:hypothetical protein